MDANLTFDTGRFESRMVIHVGDEVRTKELISYAQGRKKSFAEFLSPPRDKGVKYLKIEDNMWLYLPDVDKIIKIAGHMLRQSMMGSDFSYEDALESAKLIEKYDAALAGEEVVNGRPCYVLDLTAKVKEVTYFRRKIWVDREYLVPLRQELFALSGKKLKETETSDIRRIGAKYFPFRTVMRNLLRRDSYTEMITTRAQLNLPLDPKIFTQGNLAK